MHLPIVASVRRAADPYRSWPNSGSPNSAKFSGKETTNRTAPALLHQPRSRAHARDMTLHRRRRGTPAMARRRRVQARPPRLIKKKKSNRRSPSADPWWWGPIATPAGEEEDPSPPPVPPPPPPAPAPAAAIRASPASDQSERRKRSQAKRQASVHPRLGQPVVFVPRPTCTSPVSHPRSPATETTRERKIPGAPRHPPITTTRKTPRGGHGRTEDLLTGSLTVILPNRGGRAARRRLQSLVARRIPGPNPRCPFPPRQPPLVPRPSDREPTDASDPSLATPTRAARHFSRLTWRGARAPGAKRRDTGVSTDAHRHGSLTVGPGCEWARHSDGGWNATWRSDRGGLPLGLFALLHCRLAVLSRACVHRMSHRRARDELEGRAPAAGRISVTFDPSAVEATGQASKTPVPSALNAGHDRTLHFTMPRMGHRLPPTEPGTVALGQVMQYHGANNPTTGPFPKEDPRRVAEKTRRRPYPRATSLEATAGCQEVNDGDSYTVSKSWKARFPLGPESPPPSPASLVIPYYEQHETRCYAPLLDVRSRGRNQDKTLLCHPSEWLAAQSLAPTVGAPGRGLRCATLASIPMADFDRRRFPMGSSDPFPAGYEIRFGSLHFQATGNGYLMRILSLRHGQRWLLDGGDVWDPALGVHAPPGVWPVPTTPLPQGTEGSAPTPRFPYGLGNTAVVYASSVSTSMGVHDGLPSYLELEEERTPGSEHPGWDYSGLRDRSAFLAFQSAADYCLTCSDDSDDDYDPTRECFVINNKVSDGHTTDEDDDNDGAEDPVGAQPPDMQPRAAHLHDLGGGNVSPPAHSNHNPPNQDDGRNWLAPASSPKTKMTTSHASGQKLHVEAQKLVENAAQRQPESSASRLRRSSASKGERGGESSVRSPRQNDETQAQSQGDSYRDVVRRRAGEPRTPTAKPPATRVPVTSRLRDTRGALNDGDARSILNWMRQQEEVWTRQPRHDGRDDARRDQDTAPEPAGTRVFSRDIRTVPILPRFRQPTTITKYSGEMDPKLGGATDDAMIICNLPLHLADSARTWLEHLPPNRIYDWNDLVETFVGNFQGTYPGESLRDFIRRFSKRCTELPNLTDHQIIHSFLESTTCYSLVCKLGRDPPPDANRLFKVASKYASGEEAANAIFNGKKGKRPEETPAEGSKPKNPSKKQKYGKKGKKARAPSETGDNDDEALAVDPNHKGPRGPPRGGGVFDDLLKKPCPYHKTAAAHTLEQNEGGDKDDDGYPEVEHVFFIVGGPAANMTARQRHRERREVLLVQPATPSYLDWSSETISFGREDHPDHVPNPEQYPLVVDPVIGNTRFSKVLMDKGSSLNIMYAPTLEFMGISTSELRPNKSSFHGVASGKRVQPLGQIDLLVCFGTPRNFRKEVLTFEVVGFKGAYHAILEQSCYAKFMVIPNYTYLKMKMLGPHGIIAVGPTVEHAYECNVESIELAEALAFDESLVADLEAIANMPPDANEHQDGSFVPDEDTKTIPLNPDNNDGKVLREVVLVDCLCAYVDIFAWSPSDMPGIPREVAEHSLDIRPHSKPVKQRLRRLDEVKRRAIGEEVQAPGGRIKMKESDHLATSFITSFGMYCYVMMPFGLQNAGATYQRCMLHVFEDHIGRIVEAYVDDIVVKTKKADDLVHDLKIVFDCLRAHEVKLNPEKCRGIELNPEKPIRDLKGVQKVMGCLASLSRFISRLGEKGLPMYRLLRKSERFTWTAEAQEALDQLKTALTNAPVLTSPREGEPLYLYVAATTQVVSAVVVVERVEEGHSLPVERPMYYVSEVLAETKMRYPHIVLARRKLRHYFEAHPAIKSQILADFVAEWMDTQHPPSKVSTDCWEMYFDGSMMKTGAGAGLLFISPRGEHIRYAMRLNFPASNNMAEYEAILTGLRIALDIGIKRLDIRGDSQLVVDQVMKESSCHDEKMAAYCEVVRSLEDKFEGLELHHIARRYNKEADELAKIASGRTTVPPNVFAKDIGKPSIAIAPPTEASKAADARETTPDLMSIDPSTGED
nr:unnamed protein product [Digitaria exilis]